MTLSDRLYAFTQLGEKIKNLNLDELTILTQSAKARNGWFTHENIARSLQGITHLLRDEKLKEWVSVYRLEPEVPKIVGIIMAGNIPMVGFHDLLCVLLSGNIAAIKMSSQDEVLILQMIDWIIEIEPRFKKNIDVREKLDRVDAVIATGSDNTARYFEYYFRKQPHIIRKNRASIAILDGTETGKELKALGEDIFTYFGLGCRNMAKVFTPRGFDLTSVFPHFDDFKEVINHHKYRNNYDYYKAILLVNKTPHLDTGCLLINTTTDLVSPTGILYHQEYESKKQLLSVLKLQEDKIQCIVGHDYIPFGQAQSPDPWDYADGVDVMGFLENLT
ncbi:MAG: acyl-CoA reductase [Cytophagales bacterium]|nr:acyl-CoA reductase [Cytophagales bacterium]